MRQIVIILSILVLSASSYGKNGTNMLQKENLKGKVKSIHVTDTDRDAYVKVYFDETGKITKKENQWSETYRIIRDNYVYDDEERLIAVRINNMSEFIFTHNPDNEVVVFHPKNGSRSGTRIYRYDKNGNCISETIVSENAGDSYIERIYNEKNQLVEAYSHWGAVREKNVWKTNSLGRAYEETTWGEPKKENHTFYEYNKFGDVSLITVNTETGKTIEKIAITYNNYDDAGNWLELTRSTYLPFDGHYNIYNTYLNGLKLTRTIEYYDE